MYLCLIITIDRERSILLITIDNVNTVCACVYFSDTLEDCMSYLLIVLMGHTMFFNISSALISFNNGRLVIEAYTLFDTFH